MRDTETIEEAVSDPRSGADEPARRPNYPLHLLLFGLTCLTTTRAGIHYTHGPFGFWDTLALWPHLLDGLLFSVPIMAILLSHEMGHYVAARIHGVPASLPFFLPIPSAMVGTMGAVIGMPGRIRDRNALVDIGAAGPLAGLVVAIPVLTYGIYMSAVLPTAGPTLLEGNSLLYIGIKVAVTGVAYPQNGLDVNMHPAAWAGWVGLLVTMINLIPIGQLDGGHIAYGYVGFGYNRVSAWLHRGLPLLGVGASAFAVLELVGQFPLEQALALRLGAGMPWLVWAALLLLMRRFSRGEYHPPVGGPPLSRGRKALCLLMLFVFAMILVPVPFRAIPSGVVPFIGPMKP